MRKLLRGPDLKMPELKMPPVLADLYYDLRDRRLLPLVALVAVAIVAVPFLLAGGEDQAAPAARGPVAGAIDSVARSSALTVVAAKPGLRDYRKRLGDRRPTDPFEQQYTAPPAGSGSGQTANSSSSSSSSGAGYSEEPVTTEGSNAAGNAKSGGGSGSGGHSNGTGGKGAGSQQGQGAQLTEFVFDVQISHQEVGADGSRKMGDPEVRHRVKSLTQLPGKRTPVVTPGGVNLHNGRVIFLVSDEVRSLDGDFRCVTRPPGGLCELLEIEPGRPLWATYGPKKILYRFEVTKIDTAAAGRAGDQARSSRVATGRSPDELGDAWIHP